MEDSFPKFASLLEQWEQINDKLNSLAKDNKMYKFAKPVLNGFEPIEFLFHLTTHHRAVFYATCLEAAVAYYIITRGKHGVKSTENIGEIDVVDLSNKTKRSKWWENIEGIPENEWNGRAYYSKSKTQIGVDLIVVSKDRKLITYVQVKHGKTPFQIGDFNKIRKKLTNGRKLIEAVFSKSRLQHVEHTYAIYTTRDVASSTFWEDFLPYMYKVKTKSKGYGQMVCQRLYIVVRGIKIYSFTLDAYI